MTIEDEINMILDPMYRYTRNVRGIEEADELHREAVDGIKTLLAEQRKEIIKKIDTLNQKVHEEQERLHSDQMSMELFYELLENLRKDILDYLLTKER